MKFMGIGWIACGLIYCYLAYGDIPLLSVFTWLVIVFWPLFLMWSITVWLFWIFLMLCGVWFVLSVVNHFFPGHFGLSKEVFRLPWV
jgi:hypothetical protein